LKTVNPDQAKLPDILAKIPSGKPIIMINLLKFKEKARYPDGSTPCSGREAYQAYRKIAAKTLAAIGGELFWGGEVFGCPIAPEGEEWDEAMLIKYPSIEAFKKMVAMPEYQEGSVHRTAALEDSRLIATFAGT
jgi:uncharacterized protein (DUF1330 family)